MPDPTGALFREDVVQQIALTLDDDARDSLLADPRTYVEATFTHRGASLKVGLRLKGYSSFQPLTGKPNFRVSFDHFVDGQRSLGLEAIDLVSEAEDPAAMSEAIAYRLFREGGQPASRTGFGWVTVEKLSATSQGRLRKLRVIGSHLKGLSLEEGAVWGASEIVGVQLNDVRLRAAALEGVDLQSAQLADVEVSRSRLDGTIVRSLRLKKVRLVDCVWSDVLMSGGDSLKRSGLEDVLFENCKLNRALLSECRLTRVTLRDVDLSEVKVHRVDLADQVIEGNKAFLEASGVHRAA